MNFDTTPCPLGGWGGLMFSFLLLGFVSTAEAQELATLSGTVTDADSESRLPGANVALREAETSTPMKGTSTGADGTFQLKAIQPGQYVVEVRFVGYEEREISVTLDAGEARTLDVALAPATQSLETVVVSASRRQEKVLDAPASISVLQPEQIQREVTTSSIEALRSTPGVDMAQTGIDRREVVLRGFNEAFSGSAYVLTDYREAAVPSLAVNLHSIMPNMSIDVERAEVVRGPGSALYGPGVDSGVIHYFTKDPFQHPGTTVSIAGGSREYFAGQFRNAGTFTETLGWKITGQYARANEWELDPSDAPDEREIGRYRVYESRDQIPSGRNVAQGDFDDDGAPEFQLRREDLYEKFNVNGLLQYKTGDATTISLNGGYSQIKGVVQSGIGTLQADGFGYAYGQLRVQSGGLFGQIYLNANDSGTDTYVYGSGDRVIDEGLQWNGQLQYDFDVSSIGTQVVAGTDADITIPRTKGLILGRNEDDDRIEEYGGYVQTTTGLASRFELTLAGRLDYNNVVEQVQVSPRAALVYKATPQNTFRASYNRSFSSPGTNSLFLDLEALRNPLPGGKALTLQGLGAADGFTFNDYSERGQIRYSLPAQDILPSFPLNLFGEDLPESNIPVLPAYAATFGQLRQSVQAGEVPQSLRDQLNRNQFQTFVDLIGAATQAQGSIDPLAAAGPNGTTLGIPSTGGAGFEEISEPENIAPLDQTITQTFEVGYKGVIADRVIVNVDGYFEQKEDFIGPLVVESPFVYLNSETVASNVNALSNQSPTVEGAIQQLTASTSLSREQVLGLVGQTIGQTPTGVVQPDDQQVLPTSDLDGDGERDAVGGFLSYRNFGNVQYWGIDASVQVQATDQLDAFANVSIVSDNFFDNEDLDEEGTSLSLALNAPSFKAKGGADYRFEDVGLSVGASGNYVEGFPVETGPYVGEVESYFLLDARLGYDFTTIPGLRANLTVKNVLDNEHREFVGAPELGLMVLGRLTYTLP